MKLHEMLLGLQIYNGQEIAIEVFSERGVLLGDASGTCWDYELDEGLLESDVKLYFIDVNNDCKLVTLKVWLKEE